MRQDPTPQELPSKCQRGLRRPLPLTDVHNDDVRTRFEHFRKTRGFTPNNIMTMVRRRNIVRAFMVLNRPASRSRSRCGSP